MEGKELRVSIDSHYNEFIARKEASLYHCFDTIGFLNRGYWRGIDDSSELAQLQLIETLSAFLSKGGNVLDVACGKGASSKFLTKYFPPSGISGINISERQLEICRSVAPECNFHLMDATQLAFEDSSFDNVLCIEAATHFLTRHRFFEEAFRVLRPAGRLAMFDSLCNYDLLDSEFVGMLPRENFLPSLDAYKNSLVGIGFKYVRIEDCTDLTMRASMRFLIRRAEQMLGGDQDDRLLDELKKIESQTKALSPAFMVYALK